jgi:hypothetical protein
VNGVVDLEVEVVEVETGDREVPLVEEVGVVDSEEVIVVAGKWTLSSNYASRRP